MNSPEGPPVPWQNRRNPWCSQKGSLRYDEVRVYRLHPPLASQALSLWVSLTEDRVFYDLAVWPVSPALSSANIDRCFIKTRSLVDIEAQQVCDLFSFILYLCRGFHPLKTLTKPSSLLESHPIRRVIHASPPVLFLEAAQVSPKLNPLASVSPLLGDCKHVSSCRTPIPMTFKILFWGSNPGLGTC